MNNKKVLEDRPQVLFLQDNMLCLIMLAVFLIV